MLHDLLSELVDPLGTLSLARL